MSKKTHSEAARVFKSARDTLHIVELEAYDKAYALSQAREALDVEYRDQARLARKYEKKQP